MKKLYSLQKICYCGQNNEKLKFAVENIYIFPSFYFKNKKGTLCLKGISISTKIREVEDKEPKNLEIFEIM